MLTQNTIQNVMNTARVDEVIGDFINLRRRGVNLIGNCPFHDEKTPSFTVSPAKNIYKCFGCGKGGDPVRFVMDHEKISFPEAIKYLAIKYKITIEETENTAEEIALKQETDALYIVNEFAKTYFVDTLFNRSEGKNIGLSYFKERGFREATITKFQLGYSVEERDAFTKKAIEKKYNIEHLRTLGLTTQSDIDFFRSRVIFPIHHVSGKVIAFAGRTLSSDKKSPKYINSPESEIYNKRAVLYGLYFAKEAIRKLDECILVEGYTDVITLHQGNVENVVASSGTSLTKEQIKLIRRYTQNIKIIYDGDAAGIKAALRGLDLVLEQDMNVKLVLLPDKQDPDSFLASLGTDQFQTFLQKNAEDFVLFKTRILLEETGNDPIKKSIAIRDIMTSVSKIPDTFKRSQYIKQCSSNLKIEESILHQEVNKIIKSENLHKKVPIPSENPDFGKNKLEIEQKLVKDQDDYIFSKSDSWQEKEVCTIMINFGIKYYDEASKTTVYEYILTNVREILPYFDIPFYRTMIELVFSEIQNNHFPDHHWYINHEDDQIRQFANQVLISPYVYASWDKKEMFLQTQKMPEENYVRDATNAVMRLQLRKSQKIITQLQENLNLVSDVEKTEDYYNLELKVMMVLIEQRNALADKLGTVTFN